MLTDLQAVSRQQHLFFSPHLDDAVFSCGGWMAKLQCLQASACLITVFAGMPSETALSPFAQHLHAKWCLVDQEAVTVRRREDQSACHRLGLTAIHWTYLEAVYRQRPDGTPAVCSYQGLKKSPADQPLLSEKILDETIKFLTPLSKSDMVLYFPLGLGGHIDHIILADVGRQIRQLGYKVAFYEDWPYSEAFVIDDERQEGWRCVKTPVDLAPKLAAIMCYSSQVSGVGGDIQTLRKRFQKSSCKKNPSGPYERYWCPERPMGACFPAFKPAEKCWRFHDFKRFLDTMRDFASVKDFLPPGKGYLLDVGSGTGIYKSFVESMGYEWLGFDVRVLSSGQGQSCDFLAQARDIPLRDASVSGVLAWCVLAYLEDPKAAVDDMARVLKPGGSITGMVSFLEPVHGRTYQGLSELGIRRLLQKAGFEDIRLFPGINSFTLLLWTMINRRINKRWAKLAFLINQLWYVPLTFFSFGISWLRWRFAGGTGYGMQRVIEQWPLDFAGHIVFTARKGHGDITEPD